MLAPVEFKDTHGPSPGSAWFSGRFAKRAVALAIEHRMAQGFACKDTSTNKPYDLLIRKGNLELKVEVKGTTSDACDAVLMTKNEVDLHRREKGGTGLVLVSRIRLQRE